MNCELACLQATDESFIVIICVTEDAHGQTGSRVITTVFPHENIFMENVIAAGLPEDMSLELLTHALLVAAGRHPTNIWLSMSLTSQQQMTLGLIGEAEAMLPRVLLDLTDSPDLQQVLVHAPLAITILSGPQHRFVFINPAFVKITGRNSSSSILGKVVREALPELEGQPFFPQLDRVYRTGKPYVGLEVRAEILNERIGEVEEAFFDFIYHPLRNRYGVIEGILCVASDVRGRVHGREVSEHRESQLFQQWAELETMYEQSPIGMCLLEVPGFRILRINEIQAELMGGVAHELIGKAVLDVLQRSSLLEEIYTRVVSGEVLKNFTLTTDLTGAPGFMRTWLLNFTPIVDTFGNVERIASTALEITK